MFKKHIFVLLLCLCCTAAVLASPAYPRPVNITQPDGTVITIVGHGNEICHYATTLDGYTVMMVDDGFYYYAAKEGGRLVSSKVRANNAELRSTDKTAFLSSVSKGLHAEPNATEKKLGALNAKNSFFQKNKNRRNISKSAEQKQPYRGLVLLVNFVLY